MAMKAKYQKYLDALKGADFSSAQSQFTSGVSGAKNNMKSMQSSLSSWQELASTTVNNETLPMISSALDMLESNGEVLAEVNSKVKELVSSLEALESLENEKDSLGSKWSYTEGGSHTQSEVNSHNNKIDEVEKKIAEQEGTIDGQIAAINGLSVGDVAECYVSATATDTGTETETTTEETTKETETTVTTEFGDAVSVSADGTLYWDGKTKYSIPTDPTIAAKKAQFLGKWDDPSQYTYYQGNNLFSRHNELVLFDNKTGEIINDHGSITMKPGETRVITVKLPTDTGPITQITRTTADGGGSYRSGKIVTAKSDIDPNPNNIEYVRIHELSYHEPSNWEWTKNNSYDWVITAVGTGTAACSQTCLWSSEQTGGYGKRNLKAMINLTVNVQDEDDDSKKA